MGHLTITVSPYLKTEDSMINETEESQKKTKVPPEKMLSLALVFQTIADGRSMGNNPAKGGSRLTGQSDFFESAVSLNKALNAKSMKDYKNHILDTLCKVIGNLPINATLHVMDLVNIKRTLPAVVGLIVNIAAKVMVITALLFCLYGACFNQRFAHTFFSKIENPEQIEAIQGSTV